MPRTILFHLDENCDPKIAIGLRRRGIDVTTADEAGLLEAADELHLSFCQQQGRVIFTHDADFLRMNAQGPRIQESLTVTR
jgi:predicted nuclease of predicted toxin-antitoxin system